MAKTNRPDPLYPKPQVESLTNCHGVPTAAGEALGREVGEVIRKFLERFPTCDTRHVESIIVAETFTACAAVRVRRAIDWRKDAIASAKEKAGK